MLEKVGHEVCREYYINDAGAQVDALGRSLYLRYREALGEAIWLYQKAYILAHICACGALAARDGEKWLGEQATWLPVIRQFAIDAMMDLVRSDLELLDVRHDVFTSERKLVEAGRVDEVLENLDSRGLIYTGVLSRRRVARIGNSVPKHCSARPISRTTLTARLRSRMAVGLTLHHIAYHRDKHQRGFSN